MKHIYKLLKASPLLMLMLVAGCTTNCTKSQTPSGSRNEADPKDEKKDEREEAPEAVLKHAKQWAQKLSETPDQIDEWYKTIVAPFSDRLADTKEDSHKERLSKLIQGLDHIQQALSKKNAIRHLPEIIKHAFEGVIYIHGSNTLIAALPITTIGSFDYAGLDKATQENATPGHDEKQQAENNYKAVFKNPQAYKYPLLDAYLRLMLRAMGTSSYTGDKLEAYKKAHPTSFAIAQEASQILWNIRGETPQALSATSFAEMRKTDQYKDADNQKKLIKQLKRVLVLLAELVKAFDEGIRAEQQKAT